MTRRCDIAIVGGGMVGALLALLLVRQARFTPDSLALIEPAPVEPPPEGSRIEARVSAFAPASLALLDQVGALARIPPARFFPYEKMRVWASHVPPDSPDALCFDAAESGEPRLGAIIENRSVQAALLECCRDAGVPLLQHAASDLAFEAGAVTLSVGPMRLTTELLVGADGSQSAVRAAAGIACIERPYGQTAIVGTVSAQRPRAATALQRFLPTGPLALLPLSGDQYSIVWSMTHEQAPALLAMDDAGFNAALTQASDGVMGELRIDGPRAGFALRRIAAERYVAGRCVLVGDAAHVIHPLAGQGVNQGLLDAGSLSAVLAERPAGESPGAQRALRRYERERRAGNARMGAMVDGLDQLFTQRGPLLARMAGEGMALLGRSGLARQFFFRQAAASRSSPRR